MTSRTFFRLEAKFDVLAAQDWYRGIRPELAFEFEKAVAHCVDAIQRFPEGYPQVHKNVRRAVVRRFPYCLFYLLDKGTIEIIACFHGSRNPTAWQERA